MLLRAVDVIGKTAKGKEEKERFWQHNRWVPIRKTPNDKIETHFEGIESLAWFRFERKETPKQSEERARCVSTIVFVDGLHETSTSAIVNSTGIMHRGTYLKSSNDCRINFALRTFVDWPFRLKNVPEIIERRVFVNLFGCNYDRGYKKFSWLDRVVAQYLLRNKSAMVCKNLLLILLL